MVSHYFSQSQESKHGSSIFKERDLGDQYLTQRLLKDLLADPPPPPEAAAVFDTAADFCNAASQDPSVVSRSRPNAGTLMPVSKQRRTSVRMPTGNIATAPLELSGTASKKPRKAQLGKPEHVIRMTSRKSIMSAKSQQPVFSSTLEPSSSSAISDARFGAAPDVFGDSYAPSLTTIVALPDARRGFGRCSSDGESVTSPLAREEPPGVFGNARQKGTTVAKSETGQSGLTRKGVRGTKSETKVKEENRAIGLCGKGSRKVKAGSEIRRRSSSGSTGPEVSSAEKTAATSSPVTKNEKTADQKGEKKKPYPRTERVSNGTEVSDAVSVASCQPEGLKWAKGSAESMVTGLTRKVHELEAELSRSRSAVLRLESDLLESRACEAEVRLLLSEQTGQLAGLQEKVNQADGLVEEVRKRETELVEMAGFVRGLQERVKGLEQENVALRRRGSKSARAEKGEGTQGLVEEAENVSAVTENGIEDETGFATANKAGFAGDSETAVLAANEDGFGTRFNCKVADGVDGNGDPPGQSSAESEKVDSPEAERLRQEVTRLTEQLDEMKAFLADYGLTWVGEMGTSHVVSSSGQSFPGSDSSDKRPGSATGEGHWEPSRSWAPVMGQKRNAAAVKGESAPTKTPSVSVPSWLAAHLEEQNGTGKAPSSDANVHSTSSPKLSSLSASLKHPTGTLPSPTSAKHETVRPAKLDVLCSSQRTPSSPEEGPSDSVRMCISSRGKRNETVDVRALREAIDGLNALASEGGATVVTSPGGREHRLQVRT